MSTTADGSAAKPRAPAGADEVFEETEQSSSRSTSPKAPDSTAQPAPRTGGDGDGRSEAAREEPLDAAGSSVREGQDPSREASSEGGTPASDVAGEAAGECSILSAPESRSEPERRGGRKWRYLAWALGTISALAAFVWLLTIIPTVSIPFLIAFIIAYLLDPVVDWFEERGIGRTVAIVLILTAGLLAAAGVILLVGPQLVAEVALVPEKIRALVAQLAPWIERNFDVALPRSIGAGVETLQVWLTQVDMSELAVPTVGVARALMDGTAGVLGAVIALLLVPVFAFFLLRDFDRITAGTRELVPHRYRRPFVARFREIDQAMSGFVRGQLTVAAILAVLYTAGLWAVGLPLALLVGVVSGLGNMIPYLGTALGLVLATLVALLDWQGFGTLLLVYAVFAAVQALESWLITPRIVGDRVGLSPFLVIVAVLAFGELLGFVGILLAVPLAAIAKILLRALIAEYKASPFFQN